jgi:heterotetrameric sarcosine oxidase gamma subunit
MTAPLAHLPDRARVVVIGGGVIGSSVAYHLAHLGWSDVVLLERNRLTSGTTWHSAGLMVTFGSLSETSTRLRRYTRDLYSRLEAETGLATGFAPVGFIELATDPDRLEEYRRVAAFNRHCGVDVTEISAAEVAAVFPLARTDDVLAGFHVAGDGRVNPADVTMSLSAGARMRGVRLVEGTAVTGIRTRDGRVTGVETEHGHVECEYVVNCAGMWARQLGEEHGVTIPLQAAEHYYLITEQIPGISRHWPVIEDPASHGYYREEAGGLMIGLFEPVCAPWMVDRVPDGFAFGEIAPDWDRMGPYLERAMTRVPVSAETGIRKLFCGPESFTPDLSPVVGEAPEIRNYFVAAGLNSIGILTGGGIGRVVAQWIVDGRPDVDVTAMNVDRLRPHQLDPEYRRRRTVEMLGMVYQTHYPTSTPQTARDVLLSPLHQRLRALGAHFREVSGWESPDWYAEPGSEPPASLTWGRPSWFDHWRAEHEAARTRAVLIDMSFMSKFWVAGADAGCFLDQLSTGQVDGPVETIVYTQWLNEGGTLEADLTVTKLRADRFLVVATDTAHRHVETWMRRHAGGDVTIIDASADMAQINLQGPASREILGRVTAGDVSNDGFPFRTARHVLIDGVEVLCVRITYVGELGYELYVPAEDAAVVYDRLWAAGQSDGLRPAGLRALGSLRLEKAYRDYGHDIDNTDRLWEVGLHLFAAVDKPGGFIGRDALVEQLAAGPPHRRLVQVLVQDPDPLMFHAEVLHRDGSEAGYLRSASYGHTLGGAVGLAMVESDRPLDSEWLSTGTWEVDIAGVRHPASISMAPMYDSRMERVRM